MQRRISRWLGLIGLLLMLGLVTFPVTAQEPEQAPQKPEIAPQAAPACGTITVNQIECFVVGSDGNIWQITWTAANQWGSWTKVGFPALRIDPLGGLSVVTRGTTLDLFAVGYDGTYYNVYQKTWNGTSWSGWVSRSGPGVVNILEVACTSIDTTNRIECFIRGSDNHLWQRSFDGTTWGAWIDLGIFPSSSAFGGLAATWYATNYIVVYAMGGDGHAYRQFYEGSWSTWQDDGLPTVGATNYLLKQVACHTKDAITIDCAFTDNDGGVWYRRWDSSGWSSFIDLGYPASFSTGVALAHYSSNYEGIVVMSNASDGRFYRKYRDAGTTNWVGWIDQGRPPDLRTFMPMTMK